MKPNIVSVGNYRAVVCVWGGGGGGGGGGYNEYGLDDAHGIHNVHSIVTHTEFIVH